MSNILYDKRCITNTADQIAYLNFSSSSNRFAGVNSYPNAPLCAIFEIPAFKEPNRFTLKAIKETEELGASKRFSSVEELFDDLED